MPLPTNASVDVAGVLAIVAGNAPSLFGQTINDLTPLIGGTADSGCLVLISIGGAVFAAIASNTGEWSLDTSRDVPLSGRFDLASDGCKKLVVVAMDGNGRTRTVEGVFRVLTAAPAIPTLATVRVLRPWPLLEGFAEPGGLVSITFGGATFLTTAGSDGAWSIDTAKQQVASGGLELGTDGRKKVFMVCTDLVGNTSSAIAWVVLGTGANVARLAVIAMLQASEDGNGLPFLDEYGRSWPSAFEAMRAGVQHR